MDEETGKPVTILGTILWNDIAKPHKSENHEHISRNTEEKHKERFQETFASLKRQ
jgi:hypothetical protein